jgi:hypothetical protein
MVLCAAVTIIIMCCHTYSMANIAARGIHLTVRHPDDAIPHDIDIDQPEPEDPDPKSIKAGVIPTIAAHGNAKDRHLTKAGMSLK